MAKLDVAKTIMDELSLLAKKYGTDKYPGSKHSYTPFYFNLFKDSRNKIKKVLEIGVGQGPGLRMWKDFFPNAHIYGAEIDQNRVFTDNRITVYLCDQSKENDLEKLLSNIGTDIDFIVEDGSHKPDDQIFTCKTLMTKLKKSAVYVIEDVADLSITKSLADYDLEIPYLKRQRPRFDDWLVVVKHPKND